MILDTNALSAAADDDPGVIAQLARADEMAIPALYWASIATESHCREIVPPMKTG